jgi:hypothetical protein
VAADGAGILTGRARILIAPDFTGFIDGAQAKIKSELASLDTRVTLHPVLDKADLAKLKAAVGPLAGANVPVKFKVDKASAAAARAAIGPLAGETVPITVAADQASIAKTNADIRAELASLAGDKANVQVTLGVDPASVAKTDAEVGAALGALGGKKASIPVTLNPAPLEKADSATKALTADTLKAGDAAARSGAKYYGLWGLLSQKISLSGGLFGTTPLIGETSGWHLLADSIIEVGAVLIPATIALGAFGIAGYSAAKAIYTQMTNLNTVSTATGQAIPGLTGAFGKLQNSVKPQVYSLFGDALTVANHQTGSFATLATGAGSALDQLGARFTLAITNGKGFGTFATGAAADLQKIGTVIGNMGGVFGNVFKDMPGYAEDFLNLAVAGSHLLEVASAVIGPVLKVGLTLHGAFLYGGLAITALTKLGTPLALMAVNAGAKLGVMGQSALTAAGHLGATDHQMASLASSLGGVIGPKGFVKVGEDAEGAAAKTGLFGKVAGLLPDVLTGPSGIAIAAGVVAAGVGFLAYKMLTAKDATTQWADALLSAAEDQNSFTGIISATNAAMAKITIGIAGAKSEYKDASAGADQFGASQLQITQGAAQAALKVRDLTAVQKQGSAAQALESSRASELVTRFGSLSKALGIFNAVHISATDITKASASAWAEDIQSAQGYLNAVTELAGYQGGRALAAQAALTKAQSAQAAAVAQVTQAEDAQITVMTGAEQAFTGFAQDLQQAAKDAAAGHVSVAALTAAHSSLASAQARVAASQATLTAAQKSGGTSSAVLSADSARLAAAQAAVAVAQGKVGAASKTSAVSVGGLNAASLTLANDFWSTLIPAGQKQIDTLNAQFIGTGKLTTATADIAKGLLPFAANNTAARAAIAGLINNALGPGTVSLKNLNPWIARNSSSLAGFKAIVDQSTVAASQLAQGLQSDLNVQFHQDLLASSGATAALKTYTSMLDHNTQDTANGKSARAQLIKDLEASGLSAKQAASYVDGLSRSLGKIPPTEKSIINLVGSGVWTAAGQSAYNNSLLHPAPKAAGGLITGGVPGRDSVLIAAMPGEVMVPVPMVNAGAVDHLRGKIPGFAAGGIVPSYSGNVPGLTPWMDNNYDATLNSFAHTFVSAIDSAISSTAGNFAGSPGGGAPSANAALARQLFPQWASGANWAAWNYVAMHESGWNQFARNPSSGAYGIPQALPASKMGAAANPPQSNPAAQIKWMASYMDSSYGGPIGAAAHEASAHWYDQGVLGDWLPPGLTLAANMTGGPEAILRPDQLQALSGGGGDNYNYNAYITHANQSDLQQAFHVMEISSARRARIGRRN